jgi:TolA-binding protein
MPEYKEDIFQGFITKVVSLYYHQRQKFFIGVGIIVVAIAAIIIGVSSHGKENPEVQLRFTEALGLYSMNNVDQAEQKFNDFARRYSGNYLAGKAHFYLGDIAFQKQDYAKAKTEFERAYGKLKGNPVIGPSALLGIGNCYEEQQNLKKAAETYEQVYAKYKKSALGQEALMGAGRCYKNLNDLTNAERIYQKAAKDFPPGETAEQAKSELAYIKALKNKF